MAALRRPAARIIQTAAFLLAAPLALAGCADVMSATTTSQVSGVRLVRLQAGPGAGAWSPDGHSLVTAGRRGLDLRNPEGKLTGRVKAPALRGYLGPASRITWSPRGDRLLYLTTSRNHRGPQLFATEVGLDGGGARQTSIGTYLAHGAWSPGGWPLFYLSGRFDVGLDGKREGPDPTLWTLPRIGAEPTKMAGLQGFPESPEVSPDGERIAFVDHLHHRTGLLTIGADGSGQRRLFSALLVPQLEWSPDGRSIAFSALRRWGDGLRLYVVDAGGGRPRQVGESEVLDGPTWSPDGRWLTFSTPDGELRRIHPDGSSPEMVASFPEEEVRGLLWSPNGHRLLYTAFPRQSEYGD